MTKPNIQLAHNLFYLRKKYGLSQKELGKALNMSRQAYSNYERLERMPDLDMLVRLAQFYNISLDDLILTNLSTAPPSPDIIREPASSYTYAECEETDNSIYLTKQELNFLFRLRSVSEENRRIITGFLNRADQN